jgi:hypothetical protein
MTAIRWVTLPLGIAVTLWVLFVMRQPRPLTTYAGASTALLVLECGAALGWLLIAALAPSRIGFAVTVTLGITWMVPELAGWHSAPALLRTVADAWTSMVLAGTVIAVGQTALRSGGGYRLVLLALAGGGVATAPQLPLIQGWFPVRR